MLGILIKTELLSFHHVFILNSAQCPMELPCKKEEKGSYLLVYLIMAIPQSGFTLTVSHV